MTKKKNVVLVYPRFKYPSGDIPYGLCSVASFIRENLDVNVSILDTTFHPNFSYVRSFLEKKSSDVVGIYVNTIAFYDAIKVAEIAKHCGSFVVMGGPHATILPDTLIGHDCVDAVVIGEGEITFKEIVERRFNSDNLNRVKGIWFKDNGNIIKEPLRCPIENLDSLSFPAWDLLDMKKYMDNWFQMDSVNPGLKGVTVMASRGCPYNCTYCQPTLRKLFGARVRMRTPERVVEEVKTLKNSYGINAFYLMDDTFTAFRQWVEKFCELIKDEEIVWGCITRVDRLDRKLLEDMRKSGLRKIAIGCESASQRIRNNIYRKGIKIEDVKRVVTDAKRLNIRTQVYFMIGGPTETRHEIKETINFAVSLDADEATFSITTPLPCTYLYDSIKKDHEMSDNFEDFDYYSKRAFFSDISNDELFRLQKMAFFLFYTNPKRWGYLLKSFSSPKAFKKMMLKLKRI